MSPSLTTFRDDALIALDSLGDKVTNLLNPTVRLGVTGLSRAGKTVFISSLVHNLLHGGRLPLFEAVRSGRVSSVRLEPQPDDAIPRFQYEDHVQALVRDRIWPDSTRAISELRLTIQYESASGWNRMFSAGSCPSTSLIIRASGCSICRSWVRIIGHLAKTRPDWPDPGCAENFPRNGWIWPRRLIRMGRRTK